MLSEEWRPVAGYEGLYEVSSLGRVRSLDRVTVTVRSGAPWTLRTRGRMLALSPNSGGYLWLSLYRDNLETKAAVHRLVAQAFVDGEEPGLFVCHNDGDNQNNRASNLRWDTQASNAYDSVRHGTHPQGRITHCPRGHEYTPENTYVSPKSNRRTCKICLNTIYRPTARLKKEATAA